MAHNLVTQVSQDFDKNKKIAQPVVKKRNSVTEEKDKGKKNTYALLPPLAKEDEGKKTLVLDLDETLVHSSFKPIANPDFVISIELDGDIHQVYILKRPGVDDFLKEVGKKFEVVIFTASLSKYADPLLDKLDIHKAIKYRLFREHCVQHYGSYVKDLSKLGRDLCNCMIVDNSPYSYIFQPEHAIPITSWFNDKADTELAQLLPILDQTTTTDDVTKVLSLHFVVEK